MQRVNRRLSIEEHIGAKVASFDEEGRAPRIGSIVNPRERDILRCIGEGNGEIAERLEISVGTVKNCPSQILNKLDLRDRTQLTCLWHSKNVRFGS